MVDVGACLLLVVESSRFDPELAESRNQSLETVDSVPKELMRPPSCCEWTFAMPLDGKHDP